MYAIVGAENTGPYTDRQNNEGPEMADKKHARVIKLLTQQLEVDISQVTLVQKYMIQFSGETLRWSITVRKVSDTLRFLCRNSSEQSRGVEWWAEALQHMRSTGHGRTRTNSSISEKNKTTFSSTVLVMNISL